jgi:hypothetical protein
MAGVRWYVTLILVAVAIAALVNLGIVEFTFEVIHVEDDAAPWTVSTGASVTDFQTDGADYIESADLARHVTDTFGIVIAFTDAACDVPGSTALGTIYRCQALGSDGVTYAFDLEITGPWEFTVQAVEPAPGHQT